MNNINKIKCFASYSKSDTRSKLVYHFIKQFEDKYVDLTILIDESLEIGSSFNEFMSQIEMVNVAFVFLTPDYKRKCENNIPSGVLDEYNLILKRLNDNLKLNELNIENNKLNHFIVIPILFSDTLENSVPNQLKHLKEFNCTDFIVGKNGIMNNKNKNKYDTIYETIYKSIISANYLNKEEIKYNYINFYNKLFIETKHDVLTKDNYLNISQILVKTNSFKHLMSQTSYFFIGRKGAGKSTLATMFYDYKKENFKDHIIINIDKIRLDYLNSIILGDKVYKDLNVITDYTKIFEIAWISLIYISAFKTLIKEEEALKLKETQSIYIPPIKDFIEILKGNSTFLHEVNYQSETNALFQWCVSKTIEEISNSISYTRSKSESFHYDLNILLDVENIIVRIFSQNIINCFNSILASCVRKFLISFDGFDSAFGEYRKYTFAISDKEISANRINFEHGFLEGFINTIFIIKDNSFHIFYKLITLCVTIPKDRFFEFQYSQRDSYRYINRVREIKWSGIELIIMLRKRLELLLNVKVAGTPIEKLNKIFSKSYLINLPKTMKIYLGTKIIEIDLHINIIRHTFWRPREILIYYAKVLAILQDYKSIKRIKPDNSILSNLISQLTFSIINTEFIREISSYCKNIENIIKLFKRKKQILEIEEVINLLNNYNFQFINTDELSLEIKIEFLFEVGFLGVEVPISLQRQYGLNYMDNFIFNTENTYFFKELQNDYFEGCKFLIHPIFCEYLGLDTVSQDRLVLNLTWKDLQAFDMIIR